MNAIKKAKKPAITMKIAVKFARTSLKKLFILNYLIDMSYNIVVLLLGSNINDPENNIQIALEKIENKVGLILINSEFIISAPVDFVSYNNFCNIAVKIKTQLSPVRLLQQLKNIEKDMGRLKDSAHFGVYQDRIIDIDIILFNNIKFISERLVIPHHKNLFERDFAREIINEVK
ncbi:2-amino-4-hydroxy-6-hydroxymethyldihydropteridine diphosphokinase [Epilithonimonas tenax]|uniref:2-amino-4-hydroxy-6- hydroxymethyldihydropteridine diphosphokinase n=1 Tax=Epilithonimonas tenax TaxID=191577 RepID=UPI001E4B21F3|nr:2-amino-4-hydroxy-6-hydroxymethyldihydropteridine diphosphokinase [Epilithonimonas tenax]